MSSDSDPNPIDQSRIPRGHPWVAWGVIVAVVTWIAALRTDVELPAKQAARHRLQSVVGDWQARYLVGAAQMFSVKENEDALLASIPVDRGPIEARLRNIILLGELHGPAKAAEKLTALEESLREQDVDQKDRDAADTLAQLYDDLIREEKALPSIGPEKREELASRLGWSGRLALHPADGPQQAERADLLAEAQRTVFRALAGLAFAAFFIVSGIIALATIVLLLLARPQSRALEPSTGHGGVYAETFAVWISSYVALSYLARLLPLGDEPLLLSGAVMLLSLASLGWPVIRGVPWELVRKDIGLHLGRRPLVELLLGPVAYLAAIPLAIFGLLIVVILLAIAHRLPNGGGGDLDRVPYHPVVGWLLEGDWWAKLQVVLLASVLAPLAEETVFRGLLYRQLRDATVRFGYVGSALASGLVTSLVFAAIHPQGFMAIPALMGLALAFSLAREWRGTLLPAMIAHGLNNGLVTCALVLMGSG